MLDLKFEFNKNEFSLIIESVFTYSFFEIYCRMVNDADASIAKFREKKCLKSSCGFS